jgi:Xaa-Pro aminopeptidase
MKTYSHKNAKLQKVIPPKEDIITSKVTLTLATITERKKKILYLMEKYKFDVLVIYSDLEHGSNFEYITGFLPRFEEALLVLHKTGELYYLLGNENLKLANYAHHKGTVIHVPQFSLPNQPMYGSPLLSDSLKKAEISENDNVGIVGWKLFTSTSENNTITFDIPHYIIKSLEDILIQGKLSNATGLFIGNNGVRRCNNANELVHYSFGAQLASKAILRALDSIELGKTEMDIASQLDLLGQPKSVVAIVATGQRFEYANLYPSSKQLKLADTFSLTIGYKGGLQSRSGYLCENESLLPTACSNYIDRVVKPYFTAVTAWIENIHIGMNGNEIFQLINTVLPQKEYGWTLNPGHLIANEEWMSSPIYENSKEILQSGMMLQIDIIPSIQGYPGTSAECGIALVDEQLRNDLAIHYPEFLAQCQNRGEYLLDELGINISKDVLILSNATLYLRPLFLNKEYAMTYSK